MRRYRCFLTLHKLGLRREVERQKGGGRRGEMAIEGDNDLVSKISFRFEVEGRTQITLSSNSFTL